jgi:hypothetical protein
MKWALCLLSALVVTSECSGARAQSAEAEELFKQGRAALEAKDYATACPKFAASLQIERAVGTLISLAECEEATGHLAGARQHWQEAADLADATFDRLKRGPYARQRFAQVDARVPRLVLRLARGAPADSTVRRDDVTLGSAALGTPLPVDPGAHVISVVARGHSSKEYSLALGEGDNETLEVEPGPVAPAESASPAASTTTTGATEPGAAAPAGANVARGGSGQRVIAYVLGGVGVVGIAVGSYFGLQTFSKWSAAKKDCGGGCDPGSPGQNERSDAQTDGTISTVAFAAGGVALAAAAWLFFTAPPSSRAGRAGSAGPVRLAPVVGREGGSLVVAGSW